MPRLLGSTYRALSLTSLVPHLDQSLVSSHWDGFEQPESMILKERLTVAILDIYLRMVHVRICWIDGVCWRQCRPTDVASYGESWLFQPDELLYSSASGFLRIDSLAARCAHRKFLFVSMKVLNRLHA